MLLTATGQLPPATNPPVATQLLIATPYLLSRSAAHLTYSSGARWPPFRCWAGAWTQASQPWQAGTSGGVFKAGWQPHGVTQMTGAFIGPISHPAIHS